VITTSSQHRSARWAGAVAAGFAIGLAELFAGLFERVPSAIASVGSIVVDRTPRSIERTAIELFGTADKGALAIGTVIIAVLIGMVVGRLSLDRRWVAAAAFGAFGALGIIAGLDQPLISPAGTVLAIGVAAAAGWWVLTIALAAISPTAEAPTDALPVDPARRSFTRVVAGAGVAAAAAGLGGRAMILRRSEETRADVGEALLERIAPPPAATASFENIPGLTPIIVPNDDFYRIDTALVVPRPDPRSWRLKIKGLVDREVSFTYDDLYAMELHDRTVTIACVSNEVGGDLVGNAQWTGVRLVELLDMAGVRSEATQIVGRSVDGWTSGFPTAVAYDGRDPLVAVGMNGEPLPARHGFPARLIVPGLYGYVSATKWLEEIELTRWEDFDAYWIPRGWSKEGPIKTQSRIDHPRRGETVAGLDAVVAGVAWAPTRGVSKVEVRFNGGDWLEAEVSKPMSDDAWVQWKIATPLAPGDYEVQVRATDGTGATQTDVVRKPAPNGATGHHGVRFTAV
jgi:DMSO/TMAO reductase YedYZ molybdopterin-dependent catalytic subunit